MIEALRATACVLSWAASTAILMVVATRAIALDGQDPHAANGSGFRVRPGSQELLDQALSTIEKIRSRTERLANRAAKGDDLKGRSDSLRKEMVELYRMIYALELTADELLLRGERDGDALRQRAGQLTGPLDEVASVLRPHFGSPQGLANAAARRAKEQMGSIKQLDELIKQHKWTAAHQKLEDLLEAADEVGRFLERAEAETLYRPLQERFAPVRAGYLKEKKPTIISALREEFSQARPNLELLRKQLASVSDAVKQMREVRWNDQPIDGPALIGQLSDTWPATDASVLKSAAVLHAIGPDAATELRSLQSDYEAARIEAVTLVRDLIVADTRSDTASQAEAHYVAYLAALPKFMTALHITPENALASTAALNQLVTQSPALESRVRAYRAATSEAMRWRRRVTERYRQRFHEQIPAEPLNSLIDQPPARTGENVGPPLLPGQQAPAEQRRFTQMAWTIAEPPEQIAAQWTEQWRGTRTRVVPLAVRWQSGGEPVLVSGWHIRAVAEIECSRQTLLDCIDRLTRDLLLAANRPPITLEAAVAIHTAVHGPYREAGGKLRGAVLENLPDRLFDRHEPGDLFGALTHGTLIAYPAMPGLLRLQFEPDWFVHDLFAGSTAEPVGIAAPTPSSTVQPPPVADQSAAPQAPAATRPASPDRPPGTPAPTVESIAPATPTTPPPPTKKEPNAKPPAGGFRF